ncbi:MAG: VCBS repeat-containing protein [Bdellovibrionales bacterium]|nr:VCBS repeat-containing protein [Bdellovibrionales bacterium]
MFKLSREFYLSLILVSLIAAVFWLTSRYPQLNEKQAMGERIHLSEALSFDQAVVVKKTDPYPKRVWLTTVNWVNTNKKGMTFGLLFAAAILTLFTFLKFPVRNDNGFLSSLMGTVFGTPLGVCVNCAAPIGKSVFTITQNIQMALATMHTSPTLNFITLTMLFNLFPIEFAFFKVGATLIFILVIMPLLVKSLGWQNESINSEKLSEILSKEIKFRSTTLVKSDNWFRALVNVIEGYFRSLYYICIKTVPLMALSGFLGSILIESIDLQSLTTESTTIFTYLTVAAIGTFLPVPIAFDVVFAFIMLRTGLSSGLTMTLIFTLGIYSIFPFFIVWKYMSKKVAFAMGLTVLAFGFFVGIFYGQLEKHWTEKTVSTASDLIQSNSLSVLIQNECETHFPASERKNCFEEVFLKFALEGGPNVCKDNISNELLEKCNDYANFNYVTETRKADCKDLKWPSLVKKCSDTRKRVLYKCQGSQSEVEECLFQAILDKKYRWGYKGSAYEKTCLKLAGTERIPSPDAFCRSIFESTNAYYSNDLSYCANLSDKTYRGLCHSLAVLKLVTVGLKLDSCSLVTSSKRHQQCLESVDLIHAQVNLDFKKCDVFLNEIDRRNCQFNVTYHQVQRQKIGMQSNEALRLNNRNEDQSPSLLIQNLESPTIQPIPIKEAPELSSQFIKVSYFDHTPRKIADKKFSLSEGDSFGVLTPEEAFKSNIYEEPFSHFEPIAVGDINNDHWPDLLISNNFGMRLFLNINGQSYHPVALPTALKNYYVATMNFVDINNDNWLDIMVSTYGKGSFFLISDHGSFESSELIAAPFTGEILTFSRTFGDVDQNGTLDYLSGNWSMGTYKAAYEFPTSRNHFVYNQWPTFETIELNSHYVGETLTSLISDVNGDGVADLFVGNDYEVPDQFFFSKGRDERTHRPNWVFNPNLPNKAVRFTMSIDSGDINNDLLLDMYSVTFNPNNRIREGADYCEPVQNKKANRNCHNAIQALFAISDRDAAECKKFANLSLRDKCLIGVLNRLAVEEHNPEICENIPDSYWATKKLCRFHTSQDLNKSFQDRAQQLPKQVDYNLLWLQQSNGTFSDLSRDYGVDDSYWAWTARFADLDNDEWQDIYSANGSFIILNRKSSKSSNRFFHNQQGKRFVDATDEFGLTDYMHTYGYSYLDLDNDGDLDILSTSLYGPLKLYRNNNGTGQSIIFKISDQQGNRMGIGTKIIIYYGKSEEKRQIRELKLGGGFISFDQLQMHFGLAQHKQVEKIDIQWSTGEKNTLSGPFLANRTYILKRERK